jgi:hypothetical protein
MLDIKINYLDKDTKIINNTIAKIRELNEIYNKDRYEGILVLNSNYSLTGDFILPTNLENINYTANFINDNNNIYYKTIIFNDSKISKNIDGNYFFREIQQKNRENRKIALFNGYNFHHEMYGYIISWATNNGYDIDIYENINDFLGWHNWYTSIFKYNLYNYLDFNKSNIDNYKYIFLISDDDISYKKEWISNNVICINHCLNIRNHGFTNYLNVNKFINSNIDYAIPCYKININKNLGKSINVAIVGMFFGVNLYIINRLKSKNQIILHIFTKKNYDLSLLNKDFIVNQYMCGSTTNLINTLEICQYILTDYNLETLEGSKSSGSYGLGLTTLTKLIISKQSNKYWGFKNVIEFDYYGIENIDIDENVEILELKNSRDLEIKKLENFLKKIESKIPKTIYQTWETKNLLPETLELVNTWKLNNPDYEYILYDKDDRIEFIKKNYGNDYLLIYNKILPNAFKCDFFRYLLLYKSGGIYVDLDTICVNNLDYIFKPKIDFIAPIDLNLGDTKYNISNGFICSIAGHPILKTCIDKIVCYVLENILPKNRMDFCGPGLLGRSTNKFLNLDKNTPFINPNINKNILLLYFEPITELVKYDNYIVLQNKNGNSYIKKIYNNEISRLENYICWVNTYNILDTFSKNTL